MKVIGLVLFIAGCAESSRSPTSTASSAAGPQACAPQQFHRSVASCCGGGGEYFWDGMGCRSTVEGGPDKCGCICEGPDCQHLYASLDDCRRAHASCAMTK